MTFLIPPFASLKTSNNDVDDTTCRIPKTVNNDVDNTTCHIAKTPNNGVDDITCRIPHESKQ
ncbi:hypothetical protein DPMN_000355 [Dreissena polymorpha]|uniref:Uncharacterized protein n=1 Tax=Dreissena polymorpha TaxID=45954 RepID=A0A9D4RRY7_DREPO|nr:hypothetical protein DPMN_000355 [Dreissena polymorpha]